MEITEKVAYLKGLAEGMELDTEKKEGKLLAAIIDVLDDIALEIADMKADQEELYDGLDAGRRDAEHRKDPAHADGGCRRHGPDRHEYPQLDCPHRPAAGRRPLRRVLIWTAQALGMRQLLLHSTPMLLGQLGFAIACCVTVRYTMARTMPEDGIYHIGPRQLGSAGLLGAIFVFQFFALQTSLRVGLQPSAVVAPSMLTQFYCVTLLYLQTELFKKAAMQKEMDALNLLYDRQRKQYQIARQNVQIINRKCHELKVQIADLRRLQPDEATTRSLDEAEQAARMYDANAATGNEVLDVVLTEKSLLCEAQRIRLNCVADGTCLAAIEPGDLYALFSNLLDQAIDAAAQQQNDRRMIDLLVCRRQGFAVINVIGPALSGSQSDHGRRHSYELKVARRVVQKYSGTMATEPRGELFAVKIVMPLTRG